MSTYASILTRSPSPCFYELLTCSSSCLFCVSSWVMNRDFKFDPFQNIPPVNPYSFAVFPSSVNGNTFLPVAKAKAHELIPVPLFLSYPVMIHQQYGSSPIGYIQKTTSQHLHFQSGPGSHHFSPNYCNK